MKKIKIINVLIMVLLFIPFSDGYAGGGKPGSKPNRPDQNEVAEKRKPDGDKPPPTESKCKTSVGQNESCSGAQRAEIVKCPGKPPEINCL